MFLHLITFTSPVIAKEPWMLFLQHPTRSVICNPPSQYRTSHPLSHLLCSHPLSAVTCTPPGLTKSVSTPPGLTKSVCTPPGLTKSESWQCTMNATDTRYLKYELFCDSLSEVLTIDHGLHLDKTPSAIFFAA